MNDPPLGEAPATEAMAIRHGASVASGIKMH